MSIMIFVLLCSFKGGISEWTWPLLLARMVTWQAIILLNTTALVQSLLETFHLMLRYAFAQCYLSISLHLVGISRQQWWVGYIS
jgi:hypothetical protein